MLKSIILHLYITKNFTFGTNTWVETSFCKDWFNTNRTPEKSTGCESAQAETAGREDSLYRKNYIES